MTSRLSIKQEVIRILSIAHSMTEVKAPRPVKYTKVADQAVPRPSSVFSDVPSEKQHGEQGEEERKVPERSGSCPVEALSAAAAGNVAEKMEQLHLDEPRGEPDACVFVASLNAMKTDEQLRQSVTRLFSSFGELIDVKVLRDWQGRPYSFVQFERVQDAKRALYEGHNQVLDGRHVRVEQARVNRTLFFAKYDRDLPDSAVREILESYGAVEDLSLLQNYQTGKAKGCGFVKYHYRQDAIKAFTGLKNDHRWVAEWTSNLDKSNVQYDTQSVFIGQLNPQKVTEENLRDKFEKYGEIQTLTLIKRQTANVRPAFAFIKYSDAEAAQNAVAGENAREWFGNNIRVSLKELNPEHASHGHSGGGERKRFDSNMTSSTSDTQLSSSSWSYIPYYSFYMNPEQAIGAGGGQVPMMPMIVQSPGAAAVPMTMVPQNHPVMAMPFYPATATPSNTPVYSSYPVEGGHYMQQQSQFMHHQSESQVNNGEASREWKGS